MSADLDRQVSEQGLGRAPSWVLPAARYPALPAEGAQRGPALALSLVAPVKDEVGNLEALVARVLEVFADRTAFELVLVDDGSTDGSTELIRRLVERHSCLRAIVFRENRGQSAAITAGCRIARGALIATLDADLQNDPIDLPEMIARLEDEAVDAVVGYRLRRNDSFVRRASSRIANRVRNLISGDSIRDTGCSLKVFRAHAIGAIPMFDGMHRFLPTLLRYHGFQVVEHPVSHHPRCAGHSKYGIRNRAWRALLDLIAVRWMRSRILSFPIEQVLEPSRERKLDPEQQRPLESALGSPRESPRELPRAEQ